MKYTDLFTLSTMTLCTTNLAGEPHATPVYFAASVSKTPGNPPRLYFFSGPDTRHGQDIAARGIASAAIYPETQSWTDIRGLQLRGLVNQVPNGKEWNSAWDLYQQKFSFISAFLKTVEISELYVLVPVWIRLVNNRLGFGFKQEWTFT
jgi:uncharacterized protein YhbP (UPF0306 family)